MEIASLVLGIISLILSLIPILGLFAYFPAVIGLSLGIAALVTMKKRGKTQKGMPIAGIVLSAISMVVALVISIVFGAIVGSEIFKTLENSIDNSIDNSITNSIYDDDDDYTYTYDDDYGIDLKAMTEYDVGEAINDGYLSVVIDKIEKYEDSENLKALTGNELVMVTVTIKNLTDDEMYISQYDFELYDGENIEYSEYDSTHKEATLESGYLGAGESITGTLCFEKEEDNDDYYIIYYDYNYTYSKVKLDI